MAAATDLFRESAPLFQTTLGAAMLATDTAATLADVVGIPTTTGVTITVDQFNAAGTGTPTLREVMTGVVSGSQIIDLIRGQDGTTAQSHANGAIVQIVFTSQANNDLMTGILNQHTQSGAHGAITTTSITNSGTLSNTGAVTNSSTLTNAGLITANGGLDVAGTLTLPSGSITFADLLSTIFGGQVQSVANSGTAGGTIYYINLGGIKLLWGASSSALAVGTTYTFDFPTFFTTVQFGVASLMGLVSNSFQTTALVDLGPTGATAEIEVYASSGGSSILGIFAIGT